MALRYKNKFYFINDAFPRRLDKDHDYIAWDRCNTMIISWLNNFAEFEISQSIFWMEIASSIWKELKDQFYHGDVFRSLDMQEEICTLRQGDCSISSYYMKLNMLWQELDNFHQIPASECDVSCIAIDKKFSTRILIKP